MAIVAFILTIIIFGPSFILAVTYLYQDLTQKVYIDEHQKQIIIRQKGNEIRISRQDIVEYFLVRVNEKHLHSYRYRPFNYILIVLKERQKIIITNLLIKPEYIIQFFNLYSTILEKNIPFIERSLGDRNLTSEEFENKVNEFINTFLNYSESELKQIICQKKEYADYARAAASRILSSK